ncbi:MAG: hypothetical protein LBP95_07140, partial [Deltaproteobacteria bacterium]|nr:hypothetical protein [Deltaproteobacteria bacterium]
LYLSDQSALLINRAKKRKQKTGLNIEGGRAKLSRPRRFWLIVSRRRPVVFQAIKTRTIEIKPQNN